eukprot:COSAG01_NODE_1301_length_10829_cov_20.185182_2_plen_182_part_00
MIRTEQQINGKVGESPRAPSARSPHPATTKSHPSRSRLASVPAPCRSRAASESQRPRPHSTFLTQRPRRCRGALLSKFQPHSSPSYATTTACSVLSPRPPPAPQLPLLCAREVAGWQAGTRAAEVMHPHQPTPQLVASWRQRPQCGGGAGGGVVVSERAIDRPAGKLAGCWRTGGRAGRLA